LNLKTRDNAKTLLEGTQNPPTNHLGLHYSEHIK